MRIRLRPISVALCAVLVLASVFLGYNIAGWRGVEARSGEVSSGWIGAARHRWTGLAGWRDEEISALLASATKVRLLFPELGDKTDQEVRALMKKTPDLSWGGRSQGLLPPELIYRSESAYARGFDLLQSFAWPIVALVGIIVLWRSDFLARMTELTVAGVTLKTLESKVSKHDAAIEKQDVAIEKQADLIRNLARYSMSNYIFDVLKGIDETQRGRKPFIFVDDGTMWGNIRFLIDNGYIEEVYPKPNNRDDISGAVRITPVGRDLIKLRLES